MGKTKKNQEPINVKITAKDQDGNILYETAKEPDVSITWASAVLWSDGLEEALGYGKMDASVTAITITAERIQTDSPGPEPVSPAVQDEDEDEDESGVGDFTETLPGSPGPK